MLAGRLVPDPLIVGLIKQATATLPPDAKGVLLGEVFLLLLQLPPPLPLDNYSHHHYFYYYCVPPLLPT